VVLSSLAASATNNTSRGNHLTKLKCSSVITIWCLTALVAQPGHSSVRPAFASSPPAQAFIIKGEQKAPARTMNGVMAEEFSFLIKDFKIDQQGETNNLNITVKFRYRLNIPDSEYPDFRAVAKDIETFLTNYPNKKDYWEILNKKITRLILDKYPPITKVTCQIEVSPSPLVPYMRSSSVTRERTSKRSHSISTPRVN
jgi:hypothetical protein